MKYMLWDKTGGLITRQPVGPFLDRSTITTVMGTSDVDSGRFSSQCCAFQLTHMIANFYGYFVYD